MPADRRGNWRWSEELRRWIFDPIGNYPIRPASPYRRDPTPPYEPAEEYFPFRNPIQNIGGRWTRPPSTPTERRTPIGQEPPVSNFWDDTRDIFDVGSWFNMGADPTNFFEAAGANRFAGLVRGGTPLEDLPQYYRRYPRDVDRLLDFYSRQFFYYRAEGQDVHEHYKSIIGRSPIGDLIEDLLNSRADRTQQNLTDLSAVSSSLKNQIDYLNNALDNRQISRQDYWDRYRPLQQRLRRVEARRRLEISRFYDAVTPQAFPRGEQPITRFQRESPTGLTSWNDILREGRYNLTARQRTDVLNLFNRAAFGEIDTHPITDLSDGERARLRSQLERIKPGLSRLIPLPGVEQEILKQRTGIERTYNYYALKAIGALPGKLPTGEAQLGKPLTMRRGAFAGLEAQITAITDRSAYTINEAGRLERLENPPSGYGLPSALMQPANMASRRILDQLGVFPALNQPIRPSSDLLRAFEFHGAEMNQENALRASAAQIMYGNISQNIRRIVGEVQDVPSSEVSESLKNTFSKLFTGVQPQVNMANLGIHSLRSPAAIQADIEQVTSRLNNTRAGHLTRPALERHLESLRSELEVANAQRGDLATGAARPLRELQEGELTAQRVAEELMAHILVRPNIPRPPWNEFNPYQQALYAVVNPRNFNDPFVQSVRQILTNLMPDFAELRPRNRFNDQFRNMVSNLFRRQGLPAPREDNYAALQARISSIVNNVLVPERGRRTLLQGLSADEIALGGEDIESGIFGFRPGEGTDIIENVADVERQAAQHVLEFQRAERQLRVETRELDRIWPRSARTPGPVSVEVEAVRSRIRKLERRLDQYYSRVSEAAAINPAYRDIYFRMERASRPIQYAEALEEGLITGPQDARNLFSSFTQREIQEGQRFYDIQSRVGPMPGGGSRYGEYQRRRYRLGREKDQTTTNYLRQRYARLLGEEARYTPETARNLREVERIEMARREQAAVRRRSRQASRVRDTRNAYNRLMGSESDIRQQFLYDVERLYGGDQPTGTRLTDQMLHAFYERPTSMFYADNPAQALFQLTQVEGQNLRFTGSDLQRYYRQLGGTGDVELSLYNARPISEFQLGEERIKNIALEFHMPQELSEAEKVRTLAALHMDTWLQEWSQTEGLMHLAQVGERGELSREAINAALIRAQQQYNETNGIFHYIQEFGWEAFGKTMEEGKLGPQNVKISPEELSTVGDLYRSILTEMYTSKETGRLEGITQEGVGILAQTYTDYLARLGKSNLGGMLRPTENTDALARFVDMERITPAVFERNTVTQDRLDYNLNILSHYFGWNDPSRRSRKGMKMSEVRGTLLTDPQYTPVYQGERLSTDFMNSAISRLDEEMQQRGSSWAQLKELSESFGKRGIYLGSADIDEPTAVRALEAMGGQQTLYSPLAMGGLVDVGGERSRTLAEVFGKYLYEASAPAQHLKDFIRESNLNIRYDDRSTFAQLAHRIYRATGGEFDFREAETRRRLADYFEQQANLLQMPEIQALFPSGKQDKFKETFGRKEPRKPRTAFEVKQAAEEEQKIAAADAYERITFSGLRKAIRGSRKAQYGIAAATAFTIWGITRSRRKDHTLNDLQGPPNLPGGNPYTNQAYQPVLLPDYGPPNSFTSRSDPNVKYIVRTTGNYDVNKLQQQISDTTGLPITSGSIYGSPYSTSNSYNNAINSYGS